MTTILELQKQLLESQERKNHYIEQAGGPKQRTSFFGSSQETRGGQIIQKNGNGLVNFGDIFK